jgi:hypothetical protein
MQFLTINNLNFKNHQGSYLKEPKRTYIKKCDTSQQKLGSAYAQSPRKFWQKSQEKNLDFFGNLPRAYKVLILVKKKLKLNYLMLVYL